MADLNEKYFWIELDKDGEITGFDEYIQYSYDGTNWYDCSNPMSVEGGRRVYFQNPENYWTRPSNINFSVNGNIGGDLSSMGDMKGYHSFSELFENNIKLINASELILPWDTLEPYCYFEMFKGCTSLVSAPELPATILAEKCYYMMFENCTSLVTAPELPATTLASFCYSNMFQGCTSLEVAPELPATTLANDCYYSMFWGCTSLVTAPELPATILADSCYFNMFWGCTSLVTAPELPATTLANDCYRNMFGDCTSLVSAPELPATALRDYCYYTMFDGCTSLSYIKMLATDISADDCLNSWVYNVSPTGTFVKSVNNTTIPIDSVDGIPVGWTVYNEGDPNIPDVPTPDPDEPTEPDEPTDPDNPTTDEPFWIELDKDGEVYYEKNFDIRFEYSYDCVTWFEQNWFENFLVEGGKRFYIRRVDESTIYQTPTLSFTVNGKVGGDLSSMGTMDEWMFYSLFKENLFLYDASELILPWDVLPDFCFREMFKGCTSLVRGPKILPATTIGASCYEEMFKGCVSLTEAPEISATILSQNCCAMMFEGCTSLTEAPELKAMVMAIGCYELMFWNCTSLISAPDLPSLNLEILCYCGMFKNCTSLINAPELPATTLVNYCYKGMFEGCSSLSYIKILYEGEWREDSYSKDWVRNVSSTGSFVKSVNNTTIPIDSVNGIPVGWTVYNEEEPDPDNPNPPTPDEPDVPEPEEPGGYVPNYRPKITIEKTKMEYGEEGGEQSIMVDYFNPDKILSPICSELWVRSISVEDKGSDVENGITTYHRLYTITVAPSHISRATNIIFTCTDGNGFTYENDQLIIQQEGDISQELPTLGSYVVLSKNEINIKKIGDTDTIQVTYTNIDSWTIPTVPEGYTIVEKERNEVSDSVVQVTYEITKSAETKNDAIINFEGTKSGEIIKSDDIVFIAYLPSESGLIISFDELVLDDGTLVFNPNGEIKTLRMNISNYAKPFSVRYTVTDINHKVSMISSVKETDDNISNAVWVFEMEAQENSTNAPFEGTINIIYMDKNGEQTYTIPFYVRYKGEGYIKKLNDNFRFTAEGKLEKSDVKGDYLDIGVVNIAGITSITKPEWVHLINPTEISVEGYDTVYRYEITVDENTGSDRDSQIIFVAVGSEDKDEYSVGVNISQYGTDPGLKYIEFLTPSLTLPFDGGFDTFQVRIYDLDPESNPQTYTDALSWLTIREESRTTEDGTNWNGEACTITTVTFKATAVKAVTSRETKVKVSALIVSKTGLLTKMENDNFTINQLESTPDGEINIQPYESNLTYSQFGNKINSTDLFNGIRVEYKNVLIGEPYIDVDWVTIKKTIDKTAIQSANIIRQYELSVKENVEEDERNGSITFYGTKLDGTQVQATVTINQKGIGEPDSGPHSNYKGYFKDIEEKNLYSVSFITNPNSDDYGQILLAGDSPVVVSYSSSERLYDPIRTSTCTVSVVSENYLMDLYTGKAQGTQVILKNETEGKIEWCGFLQPNLYNQGFSSPVETIEFEASDCLAIMEYLKYDGYYANGFYMATFKNIIDIMMDKTKLIQSYYLTRKEYSDGKQSRIAKFDNFQISEYNFFSEEGEPWTLKEVIEEICKYMGLVCFQFGDSVYFLDYDMYTAESKAMNGFRWDKPNYWENEYSVTMSYGDKNITAESYRGSDGDMSLDDVFNKVTVKCSYYNVENLLPDLFDDEQLVSRFSDDKITVIPRFNIRTGEIKSRTYYRYYDHKQIKNLYYKKMVNSTTHEVLTSPTEKDYENPSFMKNFVGANIIDMVHLNYKDLTAQQKQNKSYERYLLISQLNRPWCKGNNVWENYNFPIIEFNNIPVINVINVEEEGYHRVNNSSSGGSSTRKSVETKASYGAPGSSYRPIYGDKEVPTPLVPNYLVIGATAAFTAEINDEFIDETMPKEPIDFTIRRDVKERVDLDDSGSDKEWFIHPALCFYLNIPEKGWWNGSDWQDNKTYFKVPLERIKTEEFFTSETSVVNEVESYLFLGVTGYRIPLPKEMTTTAYMYFAMAMPKRNIWYKDGDDDTIRYYGDAYCWIKDINMQIVNRNSALYESEDAVYENIIDNDNVIDGDEIELKITSEAPNAISLSTVSTIKQDGYPTTDIKFYNKEYELRLPEQAIIERYVNQYSTPSIKTELTLDMSFKPWELITDTYWNKNFVIIGQEINYKECNQRLTLLEKK